MTTTTIDPSGSVADIGTIRLDPCGRNNFECKPAASQSLDLRAETKYRHDGHEKAHSSMRRPFSTVGKVLTWMGSNISRNVLALSYLYTNSARVAEQAIIAFAMFYEG